MNLNKILDEMQASLTKLRGHYRKKERAEKSELHRQAGKILVDNLREKTAGECTCLFGKTMTDPYCPQYGDKCGCVSCRKSESTPDLPLNARVAKALGWVVTIDKINGKWIGHEKYITSGVWWFPIKDYPNDLVTAMGAGLKYMEIVNKNRLVSTLEFRMQINFYGDLSGTVRIIQPDSLGPDTKNRYELVVHFGKHSQECCEANGMLWAETKEEAICEAIVKHAEQK